MTIQDLSKKQSLVYGFGINDASYAVIPKVNGIKKPCVFYRAWTSMLCRCYSPKFIARNPTYSDCSVCDEWKYFSVFREWMLLQDWKGKTLDKDIKYPGNKIYSPDTCAFIPAAINKLIANCRSVKGAYPHGSGYQTQCYRYGEKPYRKHHSTIVEARADYIRAKTIEFDKAMASPDIDHTVQHGLCLHKQILQNQSKIALSPTAKNTNPKDNNSEKHCFAVLRGGQGGNKFQLLTPYLTDKKTAQNYLTQLKADYPDSHIGHWTVYADDVKNSDAGGGLHNELH